MLQSKLKECKHNPWNGYGLVILTNRLRWIKNSNPKIYRLYDKRGYWKKEVGEWYQNEIDKCRKQGLKVELQDNQNLVRKLEVDIKRVEGQIKEHKNCKLIIAKVIASSGVE